MRADKPKRGPLIAVLLILAALQIGAGTFAMLKYREYLTSPGKNVEIEEKDQEETEQEDPYADEDFDQEDVRNPEPEDTDDPGLDADDPDDEEEPEDEDADDDDEDEDEDKNKDYVVMIVSAPDNYAAVRNGRGTQYQEVGRITNGHKVALKDLQNGWYEIAKGKYKGYYTHQSSFVPE